MTTTQDYKDVLDFYLLGQDKPIGSTQDETKRLLAFRGDSQKTLAILATQQDNGRGTQGRKWEGKPGNVHLTIAVPMDQIPVMITLLPLQIGVLIVRCLSQCVSSGVALKWPNDVLVNDQKIAGVLIENWLSPKDHSIWLVIGVGINVAFAPNLPAGVRPATCLQDVFDSNHNLPSALDIGTKLVHSFLDWIHNRGDSTKAVLEARLLEEWKSLVQFGQIYKIRETGENVTTLGIHADGQLKVRGADGKERLLMADYLH